MGIKPVHAMLGLVLVGGSLATGCRNDSGMISENSPQMQSPMSGSNSGTYANRSTSGPMVNNQPIQPVSYGSGPVAGSNSTSSASPVAGSGAYGAGAAIYAGGGGAATGGNSSWSASRGGAAAGTTPAVGYPTGNTTMPNTPGAPSMQSPSPSPSSASGFPDGNGFRGQPSFKENSAAPIQAQDPGPGQAAAPSVDASGAPAGSTPGSPVYNVPGSGAAMGPRSE